MTTTTAPPVAPADDELRAAEKLDLVAQLTLIRDWLADGTSARAMFAAEVVEDAIKEIEWLRGAAFAVQRGARPIGNFWATLRKKR